MTLFMDGPQTCGTVEKMSKWVKNEPKGPKRTKENYFNDLSKVKKSTEPVHGVKGPCCLTSLKYFLFSLTCYNNLKRNFVAKIFSIMISKLLNEPIY